MFGTSYQFEEQGGSGDVHLELVLCKIAASALWYQCRIEIYIINDTVKIILCRCTNVSSDAEGEFPFLVSEQEAGSIGVVKTHL